jgi:aryl-alcohol dehydrogenase-like predicted oxidoreductase
MEHRRLGASGFNVPVLSFGAGTFGGRGELFSAWGNTDVAEARRLVDICLDAGVSMFDTADVYSQGASEEILGEALEGRRDQAIISTKTTFRSGEGPNDVGSSRFHLIQAVEGSLRRLKTDYIDLWQLHGFDAQAPVEEVLSTLDTLVRAGKVRYVGVSNFSGWHLMKSLAAADRHGWPRYVANQTYYSLIGREYEWELMPLRSGRRRGGLEPARLGPVDRQGPPRQASAPEEPLARDGKVRAARRRRAAFPGRRRPGRNRRGNRQDRPAGRAELAPAAPDRVQRDHRGP